MADDLWEDPSVKLWVQEVMTEMAPKMANSAITMSICPEEGEGDVKFWVELGASIMMDKPIIVLVLGDRTIPEKLSRVADEVVRCPDGVNPGASQELRSVLSRMMDKLS